MISNDAVVKAETRFHWKSQRMRGSQSCAAPSQDASVPQGPPPQQSCQAAVYSRVRIMPEGTLPQSCPDSRKQTTRVSALFGDQTWMEPHLLTAPLGPLPKVKHPFHSRLCPTATLTPENKPTHVSALGGDQTWTELHKLTAAPLGPLPMMKHPF